MTTTQLYPNNAPFKSGEQVVAKQPGSLALEGTLVVQAVSRYTEFRSGWGVKVRTRYGYLFLCAGLFRSEKPAVRPEPAPKQSLWDPNDPRF